ncbi:MULTISPECIES: hypothetical protein [Flavobacterium]|uniref:Lipoprotein n=1 Tax=Flavobacterium hankyongi TaxID=1176532 RepID=A0ABP8ZZ23_9FLAO|nr:hypothetical protein [Flavobacterium sp. N1846]
MKYFWTLLFSLMILTSCDDGDIIEDTFNFENETIQKCSNSNVLYKINDKEALMFNAPEDYFSNKEQTQTYTIGSGNSIMYRKFASTTSTSNICNTPTLQVIDEWNAIGGSIEIISTEILNGTTIVAYNHNITFKNVTFQASDKQVVYESYFYGSYRTDVIDLDFDYTLALTKNCPGNNLIFKYNGNNVLLFDVNKSTLFPNIVTTPGSPREVLINTTTNKVVYRVYNGGLNENFFCSAITPSSPTLTEEWIADSGVNSVSGIIRVVTETTSVPNQYKHTISLYKTTFRKGFQYYSPNPNGDYVFGVYYTP